MANTQAIARSFRLDLLNGIHAFGTSVLRASTAADVFKAALYFVTAAIDATTTAYTTTGEVTGTNYTAGGATVTNATAPSNSGGTGAVAFWTPSAAISWSTLTIGSLFDAILLYNSTQSNKAVAVYTFGATTVTSGNLSLNMPVNDLNTGFLRLA